MFLENDFQEIRILLQRACDQCLLTKKHCEKCSVERLLGVVNSMEKGINKPSYLVSTEELAALTDPGSLEYGLTAKKWTNILGNNEGA